MRGDDSFKGTWYSDIRMIWQLLYQPKWSTNRDNKQISLYYIMRLRCESSNIKRIDCHSHVIQRWPKRWSLGWVNSTPIAIGSQDLGSRNLQDPPFFTIPVSSGWYCCLEFVLTDQDKRISGDCVNAQNVTRTESRSVEERQNCFKTLHNKYLQSFVLSCQLSTLYLGKISWTMLIHNMVKYPTWLGNKMRNTVLLPTEC